MSVLVSATVVVADRTIPNTPEELILRVEQAFVAADADIEAIVAIDQKKRTFENTIVAIDSMMARLNEASNLAVFMAYVHPEASIREAASKGEQMWSDWAVDFATNESLYAAVKAYADTDPQLEGEEARLLEHTLRDYRRSGMMLSSDSREQLKTKQKELGKLSIEFESNIRNDETVVPVTADELQGVPQQVIDSLLEVDGVFLITLDYPTFGPIMDYCEVSETRQKVWWAYSRRAGKKNVAVLEKIIKLRDEISDLLGYASTADYEIEVRMAKDAATVKGFYEALRPVVRQKAEKDFTELLTAKRLDIGDLEAEFKPWDFSFYYDRIKNQKYAVDSKEVQQYFPLQGVMDGLFEITQHLYGIEYREVTHQAEERGTPLWHEDVRLFEVWDVSQIEDKAIAGKQLGEFYIDLHPRDNKYSHAAQWGLIQHKVWADGSSRMPVAALVCNFTKPTSILLKDGTLEEKPSLMTHDEVETFFHEFGHCLHTVLSEATYATFAGTSVERDFVEAPSQMFEEWVWSPETLELFANHYKTGEAMPGELISGMIAARNLQSGMKAESQIYLGMMDQAFHTDEDGIVDTTQVGYDIYNETRMYTHVPGTWYQAGFGHLTGYQAGYYGYMWSLVYAQDMFQRFKELGMLDSSAGAYYRDKILSKGGTQDGIDLVKGYLGREPSMEPFLLSLGLDQEPVDAPGLEVFGEPFVFESGLECWSVAEGQGDSPNPTDYVVVHYTGWLEDGSKFDSSVDRGSPATFRLNQVIKGWTEGVGSMKIGAKKKFRIPASLAYGARGSRSIPPNATLIFDVELIDINPYGKVPPMNELPGEEVTGEPSVSESGLQWFDIVEGGGATPLNSSSSVEVHYTGWLVDGTKFDSSVDRGQTISFPLNGVIKGWTEGVGSMKVGGKRKLVIPSHLGYGEVGAGGVIPGGATLIFDVELISTSD